MSTPDAIAPDGSEVYFRAAGGSRASLVEVVLGPGGVSRAVRHRTVAEIWYILAGEGEVWVRAPGGEEGTRRVRAGDAVAIPTEHAFQFRALGAVPLRFLCFTTPAWPGSEEAVAVGDGGLGAPTV